MAMSIGACFHREHDPAAVLEQARAAESAGYEEFWVIEDCFFTSGPTLAAAALTATDSIGVGIGIMPTVARNPAVTAMEIATLAQLAPGRFHAGIGHGVQAWMAQMNERRSSPLTMLEETLDAVQRLLAGERVTTNGAYVSLDDVGLEQAPTINPPVSAGVRGPKSLLISGALADGTILADYVSPAYVTWTKERLAEGGATSSHRITAFAMMAVGPDGDRMRQAVAPRLASACEDPPQSLRMTSFFDELSERAEASSWAEAIADMPRQWWHQIAAVGDPDDAAEYRNQMAAAGVDALAFFPDPENSVEDIRFCAPFLVG